MTKISSLTIKKIIFFLIILAATVLIFLCNHFTPYLSDDLIYLENIRSFHNLSGILNRTLDEYLNGNDSRFIDLFLYRLLLLVDNGDRNFTNIVNSLCFIGLTMLIYSNISKRKKYDVLVLLLVLSMEILFLVEIGDTLFWACGAAVYLYGILWIMGMVTLYNRLLNSNSVRFSGIIAVLTLLLGICAGITNENTSGGCFLLLLALTIRKLLANKRAHISIKNSIKAYMVTTFLGWGAGMGLLLLGPGTRSRVSMLSEGNYTGIAGILASAYKITLSMKELFTPLIIILVIAIVILCVQGYYKNLNSILLDDGIIYLITGIAVCYVLAIMEPPANRAYFGGSVFLIIASINMIQSIRVNDSTHEIYRVLKYSLAALLVIATIYDASIGVINLHRLNREESERIELIQTQKVDGVNEIIVPQYTRDFDTRYSTAIASDMTEEPTYWINYFYSVYYRCQGIVAIPREEFEGINNE